MNLQTFYLDGEEIGQPKEWEKYTQEVTRDHKLRMIRVDYPATFTLTGGAYQLLRSKFLTDQCSFVSFVAFDECGGVRRQTAAGKIVPSDCEWNLPRCTVEVSLLDEGIGARIATNLKLPIFPEAPRSKNGVTIAPVVPQSIEMFDPSAPLGTYLPALRRVCDWYECLKHAINFVSDDVIATTSDWYTNDIGGNARPGIADGFQLRVGDGNTERRLSYSLESLWLELAQRFNLWMIVKRDDLGNVSIAIEKESTTYPDSVSIELLDQDNLVQSFDLGKLYGSVQVGDTDALSNVDGVYSLPPISLQGFIEEEFFFTGDCNQDEQLKLSSKWIADSNAIESVVVDGSEDFDDDTFVVMFSALAGRAEKSDFLFPGTVPYIYNADLLNVRILNRYDLPSNVGSYIQAPNADFRVQTQTTPTPWLQTSLPYGGTNTHTFASPFTNDSTAGNFDPNNVYDTTLNRFTAPTQGYYVLGLSFTWQLSVPGGGAFTLYNTRPVPVLRRYSATNVLLQTVALPPGAVRNVAGSYAYTETVGLALAPGDYVIADTVFEAARPFDPAPIVGIVQRFAASFFTTYVAEGGGILTNIDPLAARVVSYKFARALNAEQWARVLLDPSLGVSVSHTGGDPKRCHIEKAERNLLKGTTTFVLVTNRMQPL